MTEKKYTQEEIDKYDEFNYTPSSLKEMVEAMEFYKVAGRRIAPLCVMLYQLMEAHEKEFGTIFKKTASRIYPEQPE